MRGGVLHHHVGRLFASGDQHFVETGWLQVQSGDCTPPMFVASPVEDHGPWAVLSDPLSQVSDPRRSDMACICCAITKITQFRMLRIELPAAQARGWQREQLKNTISPALTPK